MTAEQGKDSKPTIDKSAVGPEAQKSETGIEASTTESSENQVTEEEDLSRQMNGAIETLKKDLEEERRKKSDISKRMLYLQADYANLQRLSEKRIAEAREETKLRFVEELISIKEDLERAMSIAKASVSSTLFDGLSMMLSRIEGILRSEDVERINVSMGSTFDPRLHEAVAYSEGNSDKEGTVLSVISNGYTMKGKVIKPALVEVARQNISNLQQEQAKEINDNETLLRIARKDNDTKNKLEEQPLESEICPKERKTEVS
jgi:molecular chaperone GrpE